jgi:hypothetical protein
MNLYKRTFLFIAMLGSLAGCATVDQVVQRIPLPQVHERSLDEQTVVAGLKEALTVGSTRAVGVTSRVNGYLGNVLIRISLPESFKKAETTLRRVGMGRQVQELEVAMNRAAEKAAGQARDVLWQAVRGMTIEEGFRILRGGSTAATDYFRQRTAYVLHQRFRPIVHSKIAEVGLARLYKRLSDSYLALPLTKRSDLVDLDEYVTERALNGLFTVLAQEEKRIRENPAARTTELLREVFGGSPK